MVERVPQGPGKLEVLLPRVDEGAGALAEEECGGRVEREAVEEWLQVDGGGAVTGEQAEEACDVGLDIQLSEEMISIFGRIR